MKACILFILFTITLNLSAQDLHFRHFTKNLDSLIKSPFNAIHTFHGMNSDIPILDSIVTKTKEDKHLLKKYQTQSLTHALDQLINDDTNVVFLSEHHLIPQNRKTLYDLINILQEKGFSRIYIEAMDNVDKELIERTYPIAKTGFLICEPTFGEIVRFAIKKKMDIFPYEQEEIQYKSSKSKVKKILAEEIKIKNIKNKNVVPMKSVLEDQFIHMSARDYSQYKNIMHSYDPEIKTIILCGHGHGMTKAYGGWRTLASWMKRHPNIHIVSIENSESITQTDPNLNRLTQLFNASDPYVLWDTQEKHYYSERRYDPIVETKVDGLWDATIFYPINSTLTNSWKSFNDQKELIKISVKNITLKTPFVIYTFLESEMNSNNPIPTSSQLIIDKNSDIEIYWRPKSEKIIIWDGVHKTPYPNKKN